MMRKMDVCIDGETVVGYVAAIMDRQKGASIALIEPSRGWEAFPPHPRDPRSLRSPVAEPLVTPTACASECGSE